MGNIVKRDIRSLDIKLLLAFDALARELNVTRAAMRLGLTQQGLSGQISRLRVFFGDPLFVREGSGVAATPQAEALKPRIRDALEILRMLVQEPVLVPKTLEGTLKIAATDYAMALLLPPLLRALQKEAPLLKIALRAANHKTLENDLREHEVDLALIAQQFTPTGLQSQVLFAETYRGAVRRGHPLASGAVTLERFCGYRHLLVAPNRGDFSGPTDSALQAVGWKREIALVVPSFSVVTELLEESDLVAVLPERLLRKNSSRLFIFEAPVAVKGFEIHAVWPARLSFDPLQHWFRQVCLKVAREIDPH